MKQLLQDMRTGKTTVQEVSMPRPRPGTALVQTAVSLVSAGTERMVVEFAEKSLLGKARSRPDLVRQVLERARREGLITTLEAALNRLDQPLALGYSSAGTIVALGEDMRGFKVGQRVACAGGGYAVHAEFAVVPRNLLAVLPDDIDFESAAFTTLGAIALHGFRLAEAQLGERVVVIGLGLLGLLAAQIAVAAGCHTLGVDVDPERVALAGRLNLLAVAREQAAETAQAFTENQGADVVLICADTPSTDPVELAGLVARDRGRVVALGAVGLNIPRRIYYEKELSFINSRSYGPGRYDLSYEEYGQDYPLGYVRWTEGRNLEAVIRLLQSGAINVKPLITHRFSIEKSPQAYRLITGKKKDSFLGVLLTYPESSTPRTSRLTFATPSLKSSNLIKVGVLGAGNFAGAVLLPAIKKIPEVKLVGISSMGGLHAQHLGKKFGFAYATSDEAEVIQDPDINTVVILTRHGSHVVLALQALQAGKHVFVEKPLAVTAEQLSAIQAQLASAANRPLLMVGFNRRFARLAVPLNTFFAERVEPLYAHYRVNAGYLPRDHWLHNPTEGGGRIVGEGCHFVDFITFLVGLQPSAVIAHGLPDGGRYHEDNVSLTFTFPDGSLGVVDYLANGDKSLPKERIEVFCGGRVAVLDDFRRLLLVRDGRRQMVKTAFRQDKGHVGEWRAFVNAIRTGAQPPIPYAHLIGVAKAMLAAVESLHSGQEVRI